MRPKPDKPVLGYPIFSKPYMCQEKVKFLQDIQIDDVRPSESIYGSSPFYYRRNEYSKPKFSKGHLAWESQNKKYIIGAP